MLKTSTSGVLPKSIFRPHIFDFFVNINFHEILKMTVASPGDRGEVFRSGILLYKLLVIFISAFLYPYRYLDWSIRSRIFQLFYTHVKVPHVNPHLVLLNKFNTIYPGMKIECLFIQII